MKAISLWQPYLAGALHGDAWCGEAIGLRCKDLDFSESFCAAINSGFSVSVIPKLDERGYWLVRISNKTGRFSSLKSYAPRDKKEKAMWLRGLFDSEGNAQLWRMKHISSNSCHRRVAMYSTNKATIEIASLYLSELGIPFTIRITKNSSTHIGDKAVLELRVIRRNGFFEFATIVGSSISRKQSILDEIVSSYALSEGYSSRGGLAGSLVRLARKRSGGVY